MKTLWLMIALLFLLPAVSYGEDARIDSTLEAQKVIDNIVLKLSTGQIEYAGITKLMMPIDLTPESFGSGLGCQSNLHRERLSRDNKLIEALRSIDAQSLYPHQLVGDELRWRAIFYDIDGKSVGAIYVDRTGRGGYVNDTPLSITGAFFVWIESNAPECCEGHPQ